VSPYLEDRERQVAGLRGDEGEYGAVDGDRRAGVVSQGPTAAVAIPPGGSVRPPAYRVAH
jgi:hypothetical protein